MRVGGVTGKEDSSFIEEVDHANVRPFINWSASDYETDDIR
jgi:hypothetical protein